MLADSTHATQQEHLPVMAVHSHPVRAQLFLHHVIDMTALGICLAHAATLQSALYVGSSVTPAAGLLWIFIISA